MLQFRLAASIERLFWVGGTNSRLAPNIVPTHRTPKANTSLRRHTPRQRAAINSASLVPLRRGAAWGAVLFGELCLPRSLQEDKKKNEAFSCPHPRTNV